MHPVPALEDERLIALQEAHILDSGQAPEFDAVVELVRDLFALPISMVALLDRDRQWFKAKCGLSIEGTPRQDAFCNYTVMTDDIFVVEDATSDPRFEANPLVVGEPRVRFYAGAPLVVRPGVALGTLCVIGTEPRRLTPTEAGILTRLAKVVTRLIDGHSLAYEANQLAPAQAVPPNTTLRTSRFFRRQAASGRPPNPLAPHRDPLTGLPDSTVLDALSARVLSGSRGAVGLLMVGADHLKEVNSAIGQDAGDELVRAVGLRLSETIGASGHVARMEGNQFAVLLPRPGGPEGLDGVARAILAAMRPSFCFKGVTLHPSVSIGGVLGTAAQDRILLRQSADLALHHAKANRRGGYVRFHDGLKSAITARIDAVNVVDEALREGAVAAWYQPVVDLATGRVRGLEALARVRRGDAWVSIGAFADALLDRRTATRLTARMIERIEADIGQWQAAGIAIPRIAFNVGTFDFQEGTLEPLLLAVCRRTGLPLSRFTVEVTETVFLSQDAGIVAATAGRLREAGAHIALDDFGTGYASLAHLATFPVDAIKMDHSFVARLTDGGPGAVVSAALVDLAHKLRLEIIAEGVETVLQRDSLLVLGCETAQGYLFSHPLPPEAVTAYLTPGDRGRRAPAARPGAGRLRRRAPPHDHPVEGAGPFAAEDRVPASSARGGRGTLAQAAQPSGE